MLGNGQTCSTAFLSHAAYLKIKKQYFLWLNRSSVLDIGFLCSVLKN